MRHHPFAGGSETTLVHDFGRLTQGDPAPTFNFDVFNFGMLPAFTAGLDFDSLMASDDSSVLTTNLRAAVGAPSLGGRMSEAFAAELDTSAPGEFTATFTLSFSDEDLAGALTKSLTLTLTGDVTASALAGDFNLDDTVDAADYTTWRDGLDSTFTLGDYDVWKANFGQSINGGSCGLGSSAAVPERAASVPTAIVLCPIFVSRHQ